MKMAFFPGNMTSMGDFASMSASSPTKLPAVRGEMAPNKTA